MEANASFEKEVAYYAHAYDVTITLLSEIAHVTCQTVIMSNVIMIYVGAPACSFSCWESRKHDALTD